MRSGNRIIVAVLAAAVLVGLLAASGAAAPKPARPKITFVSPSPAEGATLATSSVSFAFTYNRTPKATQTLTCSLSGPTSSSGACAPPTAFGKHGSRSTASYSGLANGAYTFTVSLTLTDGGTASATRNFTVPVPASATAIAAGHYHTCALTGAGGVKCWGSNYAGQLGDGSNEDSSVPVAVSGLASGVAAIAAGGFHTCALTDAGGVKCWGWNGIGVLGDASTRDSTVPVAVSGLASGVVAIAAGRFHTCALTGAGAVKCWGSNGYGELGDGSNGDSTVPVAVSGLASGVVAIAAGDAHTCALTEAGGVKCWGPNDYGQLGNGSNTDSTVPVAVSGVASGVVAIAAGRYHTCALTGAGAVMCWGHNYYGQLGNRSNLNSNVPVAVSRLASGVVAIAAGAEHTCA
ncbi:MAG: RCC1 repeat-containing protein, partial [Actinomycetota bacterium]|nr:RCC1 repeat-containing protein [Actinomycetota bacterium]